MKTETDDRTRFQRLRRAWRRERGISSLMSEIAMAPSYQRIIGMGSNAVPLILEQLENEGDDPDLWFYALEVITGENPVPDAAKGDTLAMSNAWVEWGRRREEET